MGDACTAKGGDGVERKQGSRLQQTYLESCPLPCIFEWGCIAFGQLPIAAVKLLVVVCGGMLRQFTYGEVEPTNVTQNKKILSY